MDQRREIYNYLRYIGICRKNEWLLNTPFQYVKNLFFPAHKICTRKAYFPEIMRALGKKPEHNLDYYKQERLDDKLLEENYRKAVREERVKKTDETYEDGVNTTKGTEGRIANFYALIREVKPRIVVETGTAAGLTTSWILSALNRNGEGKLISIDIPPVKAKLTMNMTIPREEVGFLIPQEYRHRWEYIAGDSRVFLPQVLCDNEADVFIHDSLHTRSHMLYEYSVAHSLMKAGAIIMSDDILWNKAFFAFVSSNHLKSFSCISNPNIGLTINAFDEFEKKIGTEVIRLQ